MDPSIHFKVGSIDCWAVSDAAELGIELMDNWRFTADHSAIDQALAEHHLRADGIPIDWLCLLVECAGQYVLVDTGSGPGINDNVGHLLQNLRAIGVEAADIDVVIISHSHFDHIGGTLDANGQPAFPNARVVLGQGERELLDLKPPVPQALYEAAQRYLPALAGQLGYVADGAEIVPGVRALAMPGHTPGSTAVEISSGGSRLLFTGDLFYHAMQVEHPDWCSQYDLDPAKAAASRERIYRMAVDEGLLILPAHAPLPGTGHITWDGASYRWQPVA
ncbi:MAG: MBL fold metallo-hydrolase [Anaerolineae bacterium]